MLKMSSRLIIATGACYSAIYNFNNNCIYRLSHQTLSRIYTILGSANSIPNTSFQLSKTDLDFVAFLQREQIIVEVSVKESPFDFPKPIIDFSWIELTQRCNLKCVHCYEKDKKHSDIPLQSFYHIIDTLIRLGIHKIQLTGGEPLLYPELMPALVYCHSKFDFIELYTNGTLLTPAIVKYCKNHGIRIAITNLSDNKEGYERITQIPNSFLQYSSGLQLLKKSGVQFRLGKIAVDENIEKIDDTCDFPRLTGCATLQLYSFEMLKRKIITPQTFAKKFIPELVLLNLEYNRCFCSSIYIDIDGNIYPCPMERRIKHGNIFTDPLENIFKPYITKMNKDIIAKCSCCEYRYACIDCRPDSNGREILEKPWYCSYDPLRGTWIAEDIFIASLFEKGD